MLPLFNIIWIWAPYVIFHDATLKQMAADKPQSDEALMEISGVGQTKLERYGPAFLEVIAEVPD